MILQQMKKAQANFQLSDSPSIHLKPESLSQVPAQPTGLCSFLQSSTGLQTTHLQAKLKKKML